MDLQKPNQNLLIRNSFKFFRRPSSCDSKRLPYITSKDPCKSRTPLIHILSILRTNTIAQLFLNSGIFHLIHDIQQKLLIILEKIRFT